MFLPFRPTQRKGKVRAVGVGVVFSYLQEV